MRTNNPMAAMALELASAKAVSLYLIHSRYSVESLIEMAKEVIPDRLELIETRHGSLPESTDLMLDLLGIDLLVEYFGTKFAIDLTISSRKHVRKKRIKMASLKPFFDKLGAKPLLIHVDPKYVPGQITPEFFKQCFERYEVCQGVGYADYNTIMGV